MDIDIATLRALEREKEVPFDVLVRAIEQALLLAYHRTEGASPHARVELDRASGHVTVWAQERTDDGAVREVDDTPEGFGRIAATTARQAILQRLRDVEDEQVLGEFRGREGDIVSGVVQQSSDPRMVHVDLGTVEGLLPPQEQVPGESYPHGSRLRCLVVAVKKGLKGPSITLSRSHPNLVRKLFALEAPEMADGSVEIVALAREAGHRTKIAVRATKPGVNAKGACIGPMGSGSARSSRSCTARRSTSSTGATTRRRSWARPSRRRGSSRSRWSISSRVRRGSWCPTTSSPSPSARRGRTRGWRPGSPAGGSTSGPTWPRGAPRGAPRHARRAGPGPRRGRLGVTPGRDPSGRAAAAPTGKIRRRRRARLTESGESAGQSASVHEALQGPVRTCVGCRVRAHRSVLLRVVAVRVGDRQVAAPDPGHRLAGRGAWVHPDLSCLDLAERRRAFPRALRLAGPLDVTAVREFLAGGRPPSTPTVPNGSGSEADEHSMSAQR